MIRNFELFVANRYLRAKRKQAVISVITVISVAGVAAGVMALVIALAITNGFRNSLQKNLLGATAHVSILEKEPGFGIENWRDLTAKLQTMPHVVSAAPSLYGNVLFSGPLQPTGGLIKGVDPATARNQIDILAHLKQGSLQGLDSADMPGIVLGSKLAQNIGSTLNSKMQILSPHGELTPFGPRLMQHRFRVVGIFETGFYELDANWAYTSLKSAQMVLSLEDVVNSIELKLDNIDLAPEVAKASQSIIGPRLTATHWKDQNKPILNALRTEKAVTVVTISLIQLVAALNILIALIMMVMEKYRDIAILVSMGARRRQIRKIFMLQGVLIGVVGTSIGLTLGYALCFFANRYHWIPLEAEVYSLSFVPFDARWTDGLWIAAMAILVSFVATIYPAVNATRIVPVEALRYE